VEGSEEIMPDWCPKCGVFGFSEYIDERGVEKCLKCNYREKIVYTSKKDRLKRLIELHLPELLRMEYKMKGETKENFCRECGEPIKDGDCSNPHCDYHVIVGN